MRFAVSAIESGRADAAGISENTATLPATTRNFARGPVVLELGGTQQALLKSADGGDTIAQVITYRSGSEPVEVGSTRCERRATTHRRHRGVSPVECPLRCSPL